MIKLQGHYLYTKLALKSVLKKYFSLKMEKTLSFDDLPFLKFILETAEWVRSTIYEKRYPILFSIISLITGYSLWLSNNP